MAVLRAFSGPEPSLSVTSISARVGLHKSTVSRLLATLETGGLVANDAETGRYRLGPGLVELAGPLLTSLDVRDVARPVMADLAAQTGASASLAVWTGRAAVNVEQVLAPGVVSHLAPVGRVSPGHATANGKVFLAWLSEGELEAYLARPLEPFTSNTITDPETFRAALARVRTDGYAVNDGELDMSLLGVAGPVFDAADRVVAAVGVTTGRLGRARARVGEIALLTTAVLEAAVRISRGLGRP
ncbi:MAG TPA: IclR family transcriptional regulator [Patescibacteria group bacterium]|jgi:DNA-binding IclR family transcriptional regulator|nr:IclR family transcriptional regulator [Patescibacteria group bacterium]